ncbi:hypothetical protein AG1IA_06490 [Rhizoctonia solani AG-1 IA]|uniref:Uncharacterized protein n=1 Tax=Thanatephorus cucumeris (strain AG1-IA) TaxID=983506 RepID=L8WMV1_THACA|nr:hypothetical protein AG1IA_06490 [Rhizoctonia solani AG-1 IA]
MKSPSIGLSNYSIGETTTEVDTIKSWCPDRARSKGLAPCHTATWMLTFNFACFSGLDSAEPVNSLYTKHRYPPVVDITSLTVSAESRPEVGSAHVVSTFGGAPTG